MSMKSARTIRDVEAGVSATARQGEIDIVSPIRLDALVAESPSDQDTTVPVGALVAWRRHIREELLEELDAAGRLLPDNTNAFTHEVQP